MTDIHYEVAYPTCSTNIINLRNPSSITNHLKLILFDLSLENVSKLTKHLYQMYIQTQECSPVDVIISISIQKHKKFFLPPPPPFLIKASREK